MIAVNEVEVVDERGDPKVKPLVLVEASQTYHSILQSSFIDPDPETAKSRGTTTSMFYWIEGDDPGVSWVDSDMKPITSLHNGPRSEQQVRFRVFYGDGRISDPADLRGSGTDAVTTPLVMSGHYAYGGSWTTGDHMHFLGQWSEQGRTLGNTVEIFLPPSEGSPGPGKPDHPPPGIINCPKLRLMIADLQWQNEHGGLTPALKKRLYGEEQYYSMHCISPSPPR